MPVAGRMEGKKAIVVGAGQHAGDLPGNGYAIATLFAGEGAEVCAVDLAHERAEATSKLIRDQGGQAHPIIADVRDPADCGRLVAEAKALMGRVDVLVNNVGVNQGDASPGDLDESGWQQILDVNLRAVWLTSRAAVKHMQDQGGGAITNISSIASRTGGGALFAYGVSKAGVDAVTHSFAVTYAPWGIRCNSVLPGWIDTQHAMAGQIAAGLGANPGEIEAFRRRSVPLGRVGSAWDVARAVLFLSSEEAGFITGVHLPVDGGALAVVGSYQRPASVPAP
jgi:NAD(P)-dependent dehydrogenase (short-subunit alcohol dehydrogenase family)